MASSSAASSPSTTITLFSITDEIENKSSGDVALKPYARLFRFGVPKTPTVWIQHEGLFGVPGNAGLQEITFHDATAEAPRRFEGKTGGWLGLTDKYWASAIIPDQKVAYNATPRREAPKDAKQLPMFLAEFEAVRRLSPQGSVASVKTNLYAGAKKTSIIENYGDELGIEKFDLMIDWGWFYFLTKPMNHALTWLYGILGNFGFAILALTVIVKLLFFPLANKIVCVDGENEEAAAADGSAARTLQGRQAAHAAGTHAALSERENQPGCGLLAHSRPDPCFLRALQGPIHLDRHAPRAVHRLDQGPVGA